MPRPRSSPPKQVLDDAMRVFWANGYSATSMAELVAATGSTRQSIYGDFGSKHGLYLACFDTYRDLVVSPALAPFAEAKDGVEAIARYFEIQISLAEEVGLPGPGCLVGNAMTEIASSDSAVVERVRRHNAELEKAFAAALSEHLASERSVELARFLVLAAQGLWAMSRVTSSADELRMQAATILRLLEKDLQDDE